MVFDGKAHNEGVRPNDIIESVNEEDCPTADQVHAKMRSTQGVLRLRLKRLVRWQFIFYDKETKTNISEALMFRALLLNMRTFRRDSESDSGTQISELSDASDKTPTVENRRFPLEDISVNFSKPPLPSYDENMYGYSGGSRGSAQDKKKYFEQLAMRQMPQTDRILERKILLGMKNPTLPSDQSSLSGYDSVGADFAGLQTVDSSDRQTPVR